MTAHTDVDVIVFLISLDIFFAQLRFWLVDVMLFFSVEKGQPTVYLYPKFYM